MGDAAAGVPFDPATGDWLAPQAAPAQRSDAPRRGVGPSLWTLLLALDLGLLGLFLATSILAILWPGRFGSASLGGEGVDLGAALWLQAAFNLLALGVVPAAWVAGTRVRPWQGMVNYLRLDRPAPGLAWGVLWGVASLAGLFVVGLVADALHYNPPNEQADAILKAVTPALAVALALSAAVGEEIFFRGLLQRWLGVWGQAALFGLFHLSYGTPLQVAIPMLLGLLYGWLVRRGAPLWTPMAAHFLFDYVQLSSPFWLPQG